MTAQSDIERVSDTTGATASGGRLGHALAIAGVVGTALALVAAAGLLWAQHGAAVFFETIAAGIAACF